jgi:hypothetical protein
MFFVLLFFSTPKAIGAAKSTPLPAGLCVWFLAYPPEAGRSLALFFAAYGGQKQ